VGGRDRAGARAAADGGGDVIEPTDAFRAQIARINASLAIATDVDSWGDMKGRCKSTSPSDQRCDRDAGHDSVHVGGIGPGSNMVTVWWDNAAGLAAFTRAISLEAPS
jgi:hypothetical protein